MQDFTAGGISATPNKTQTTGNPKTDELVRQLAQGDASKLGPGYPR